MKKALKKKSKKLNALHEEIIDKFVTMIEYPLAFNDKVGYKLSNGITILFSNHDLSNKAKARLAKHYKYKGIIERKR